MDKCKAADRGENTCDYSYNAYYCFYNATHDKPDLIDTSESTFDTVLAEKFKSDLAFDDDNWIDLIDDEKEEEMPVPQATV